MDIFSFLVTIILQPLSVYVNQILYISLFLDTFICYNLFNNFEGGALMGLIDREYMNRTPEERMADKSPELKKFRERQED